MWRNNGSTTGILTLISDFGKGFLCVWLAQDCGITTQQLIAVAAVLTHCYSIYLDFAGGKGVATAGGVILANCVTHFLILLTVWLIALQFSKRHGLASLATAIAVIPTTLLLVSEHTWAYVIICTIVVWRHKKNTRDIINLF